MTAAGGKARRAILIGLALLVASPCFGQTQTPDPFQSVPGPAPAPKPRPRPPPRPDDFPPTPSVMPAPVAPTPPPVPSLAGRWIGSSICQNPFEVFRGEIELNVTLTAPDQYALTGRRTLRSPTEQGYEFSGSISGKVLRANDGDYQGTVTSPTTMVGTVYQALGKDCTWSATKN